MTTIVRMQNTNHRAGRNAGEEVDEVERWLGREEAGLNEPATELAMLVQKIAKNDRLLTVAEAAAWLGRENSSEQRSILNSWSASVPEPVLARNATPSGSRSRK